MYIKNSSSVSLNQLLAHISRHNLRRVGGEVFWIIIGQMLAVLGAVVGVRWVTHLMDPQRYGELALGMTFAMLSHQVIWGPLGGGISRFFASSRESQASGGYLRAIRNLVGQASLASLLIGGLVSAGAWALGYGHLLGLAVLASLLALVSGYCGCLSSIQFADRQRMVVAWHQGLDIWLRFLMAVGFIYLWGPESWVAMMGYCVSSLIVLGSQIWFFQRKILVHKQHPIAAHEVSPWTQKLLAYSWPISTFGIFTWAQSASERWALQFFGTTNDVGLYAALYQIGYYPIMIISGLVVQLITPVIFAWAGDNSDKVRAQKVRRVNHILIASALILTLIGAIMSFFLQTHIFSLLLGPKYRVAASLLPLMVMAGGLFASGQLASLILMTETNTKSLIAPKIFTAFFGVLFNILGAYFMGLQGVVLACLLFALSYALWTIYLGRGQGARATQN